MKLALGRKKNVRPLEENPYSKPIFSDILSFFSVLAFSTFQNFAHSFRYFTFLHRILEFPSNVQSFLSSSADFIEIMLLVVLPMFPRACVDIIDWNAILLLLFVFLIWLLFVRNCMVVHTTQCT